MFREAFSLMLIFQVLRAYVAGSGPFLSQSPFTVTAEVGQPVELACYRTSQVEVVTSYLWYKQLVGEAPRIIDIPPCNWAACKFVSKKGNSKHELILEIRNVQVTDSGSYYCADRGGYAPLQNGSKLLVGVAFPPSKLLFSGTFPASSPRDGAIPVQCSRTGPTASEVTSWCRGKAGEAAVSVLVLLNMGSPGKSWTKSVYIPKAVSEPCNLILPAAITGALNLVLLLILISIWIRKRGRSEERVRRGHNENFSLKERKQSGKRNQRRSDDNRQTEARGKHQGAKQSQGGPLYASLEFAALEKKSKKKAGRR
ncbi:uncharacterized protein [Heterodontus francisci]|uniref:uncharacterized protein n=1 Tax=Heterodontus francisci TaxID=7792 RepID=UPI00355B9457